MMRYKYLLLIFVLLMGATFIGYFLIDLNVKGDAALHQTVIHQIIESGELLSQQPFRLMTTDTDIRYPLNYPLNFYVLLSSISVVTSINIFLAFGLFLSILISIFTYLLIKDYSKIWASSSAFLIFPYFAIRTLMSPLMEPLLGFYAVVSLYCLKRYFDDKQISYLFLFSLFLVMLPATKQQGIFYFTLILISSAIFWFTNSKDYDLAKNLFIVFLVSLFLVSPFLLDQYSRNGTIFYAPGEVIEITSLVPENSFIADFFRSDYLIDLDAIEQIELLVGYRPQVNENFIGSLNQFIFYPVMNFRSGYSKEMSSFSSAEIVLGLLLLFISLLYVFIRSRFLGIVLTFSLIIEASMLYFLNHYIYQYYPLALITVAVLFGSLLAFASELVSKKKLGLASILVIAMLMLSVTSYLNYVEPVTNSGRFTDNMIEGYSEMGLFIQETIPDEEPIIYFGAYSDYTRHYHLWVNEAGGSEIPIMFINANDSFAYTIMDSLNVSYILYDSSQLRRKGAIDYIPKNGLHSSIGTSRFFSLEKEIIAGKEKIWLYKRV